MVGLSFSSFNKSIGGKVMTSKIIKFVSVDCAVTLLLLFTLIGHYTICGLISFLIGSALLFLGTLFDKKKAELGVSIKVSYIAFITILSLMGMWLPRLIENINKSFTLQPKFSFWVLLGIILFPILAGISSNNSMNFALRRILKYLALISAAFAIFMFFSLKLIGLALVGCVIIFFCICDIYTCKTGIYKTQDYSLIKSDAAYWMAVGISIALIVFSIMSNTYFYSFISNAESIIKLLSGLLVGINVPLFAMIMIALTALFMYSDNISKTSNAADSYLSISLGGFCIVLRTFVSFCSIETLVLLLIAVAVYLVFGFSIVSSHSTENVTNPVYKLILLNNYAPIIISMVVTLVTAVSILFVYAGYLISFITLILGLILIFVSKKGFIGFWIASTMRWQMILVAIALFSISISIVKHTTSTSIGFVIFAFVISSLVMWANGIRDGVWDNKYIVSKVLDCVLMGTISIFAVI